MQFVESRGPRPETQLFMQEGVVEYLPQGTTDDQVLLDLTDHASWRQQVSAAEGRTRDRVRGGVLRCGGQAAGSEIVIRTGRAASCVGGSPLSHERLRVQSAQEWWAAHLGEKGAVNTQMRVSTFSCAPAAILSGREDTQMTSKPQEMPKADARASSCVTCRAIHSVLKRPTTLNLLAFLLA